MLFLSTNQKCQITEEQAVCVATHYATAPLLPVGAQAPCAPPSRRNVAVLSHAEYVPTLTAAAALCVKAALSKAAWLPCPFDLESGVRVTCDVGYLCANFGLPRPLCSRPRPDVRDRRQTKACFIIVYYFKLAYFLIMTSDVMYLLQLYKGSDTWLNRLKFPSHVPQVLQLCTR